jgi:superfamily II DNA helicase RecQ
MAALVLHFGDLEDGRVACGLCDFCNPGASSAQSFRPATNKERAVLLSILDNLRNTDGKSLGRLIKELPGNLTRKDLDGYLSSLAKAGLITVEDAEWIKDGETILFRKAALTAAGGALEDDAVLDLQMPGENRPGKSSCGPRNTANRKTASKPKAQDNEHPAIELSPAAQALEQALKGWRTTMAKKLGMPPFVVLHDKTLRAIAGACPQTPNRLQEIPGMGPAKVDKYGQQILEICTRRS